MNTAKLVNSALTGGGLIYPENLNVVIGSENKGYPKGTVLDANATFIASVPFTLLRMAREDQSYRYGIVYFGQLKNSDAAWATVLSKIDEYNNDAVASKAYLFLDANINNLKVADADAVDTLVLKNCALEVWTATTKDDLDNLDPYVTGVTSDNIHAGEILAKNI